MLNSLSTTMRASAPSQGTSGERQKAVRILAKSLFKDLLQQGYDEKQIVALATELNSEVTNRIAADHVATATATAAAPPTARPRAETSPAVR